MKENIKNILKYFASACFAFLLLWISFRDVEWKTFAEALNTCRWEFIALSMAAGAFTFWLRGLRWRRLILPIDDSISRVTTFNGVNIGNISNFVFPRIGEFVRCGVVTRRSLPADNPETDGSAGDMEHPSVKKASYDKVLGTVVLERGWELLVMLIMLAVVVIGGFNRFGTFVMNQILRPFAERLDFSVWWLVAFAAAMIPAVIYVVWRFRDSNSLCSGIWKIFRGVAQGFSSCMRMDRKWLFFAYTALIWIMYWFMAASTMWAAPFLSDLDLIDALFLSLVGGIGFAVPVPGGIGAFHFVISMALSAVYGVPVELGVVYATLSHTSQAVTQILFGVGSYVYESLKK